jgi:hypothetical protein
VQSNARNMAHFTTYRANVNRRILDGGGAAQVRQTNGRSLRCIPLGIWKVSPSNGAAFVDEKGGPKRPPYAALPPNTR